MKKIIAISVIFAIVAGAAFAQASFGGGVEMGTTFLQSIRGADVGIGGTYRDQFMIQASAQGETTQAFARFRHHNSDSWGDQWWAQWTPNDLFKFKIGTGDGEFGAAKITGWGWEGNAKLGGKLGGAAFRNGDHFSDVLGAIGMEGFGFTGTPWNNFGMYFSVMPTGELTINAALTNIGGGNASEGGPVFAEDIINHMFFNVGYDAGPVEVNVSAVLGDGDEPGKMTQLYASFYLKMIDNMTMDLGLGYTLPHDDVSAPIKIGFGLEFQATDDLKIKARAGAEVLGSKEVSGNTVNDPTKIGFDLQLSTPLGPITGFFQAGIAMNMPEEGDTMMGWFVNPYITWNDGPVTFHTGLKLWGESNTNVDDVSWAIPLTIIMNF